jgi:predicted transcriptional regulator
MQPNAPQNRRQLSVRIDPATHDRLRRLARRTRVPMSRLVELAVVRLLADDWWKDGAGWEAPPDA